jgi:osmotically-inducible protein OsmY
MTTTTLSKSDIQIKTDVLSELKWDPTVDETEVGVQVKRGVATLTGTIGSYAKRLAAIDAAHRVFGVLDVVDDMKVKLPTVWERTDQDIANAVRNALKWDVTVPDQKIKSTVSKGVVTLEGAVDNWMERYNCEKAIHRLTGVTSVVNKITINYTFVDPGKVRRDIEDALERQTEREAKRLDISVRDGIVTITGSVRSFGEKNAIERVAWATPGVKQVEDKTTVDPYQ